MAIIGVTGGIASGKSAFSGILSRLIGCEVLDADAIARRLLAEDPDVRSEVMAQVLRDAYPGGGPPDRAALRKVVYSNPEAKARLERILHPRVRKEWVAACEWARAESRHCIVDIPLLFETSAQGLFDVTLVVACSRTVQQGRLTSRGLEPDIAASIVASQLPSSAKIALASHVVWNDGTRECLEAQAREFAVFLEAFSPGERKSLDGVE